MDENIKHEAAEWLKAIIVALLIVFTVKLLLFDILSIDGISMEPTLHDRERVFVNIIGYKIGKPDRYDIVIFNPSIEKSSYFIKRVIGLPGDIVKISGGKVYVNNEELDENYLFPDSYTKAGLDPLVVDIPEGHVFVLGDNRDNSEDSRDPRLGPIPIKSIKGHAVFRVFPFSKMGKL